MKRHWSLPKIVQTTN